MNIPTTLIIEAIAGLKSFGGAATSATVDKLEMAINNTKGNSMKKQRITFKRGPKYSGRMRLPETYRVNLNGIEVATIQKLNGDLWYWYGSGVNTCANPASLEVVKTAVKDFFMAITSNS